jgi:vitamin B12 transporter
MRVRSRRWVLGASAALLASLFPARAEPSDPDAPARSDHEEKVEVRAAMPEDEDVAAFATTVETGDLVERGEDLAAVLARVPGARIRDYGGLGRYATVSLRASTAEQVTVFVDGVPQNRALGGPVDLSFLPATQIGRVTVFRGFGPASLGLGGLGGVVDIRTRAPGPEPEGRVDVLTGQLGTTRLSTGWSLRAGPRAALRIGAEGMTSRGDFRYLDAGLPFLDDSVERTRANNDLDRAALVLQGVVRQVAGGQLRIGARAQRRHRGLPGIDGLPAESAALSERFGDLNLSWSVGKHGKIEGIDLLADAYHQRIHYEDLEGELGTGVQDQTTRLAGGGLAAIVRGALGSGHGLLRLDVRREQARVRDPVLPEPDRGGASRTSFAVTAEDLVTFGRLTVAPSARWELLRDDFRAGGAGTLPPPAPDRRDQEWAGKLGVAWAAGPRATVRGSFGRFHRNPNLLELFGDRGSVIGNPALVPERGYSAELGATYRRERAHLPWNLEVVAFGRDVEDLIFFRANSQAVSKPENLQAARVRGVEGSLGVRLAAGLTVEASGTLQRSVDATGGVDDGRPVPYQPDRLGWVGVGWRRGRMRARWDLTYVGANTIDRAGDERLPARVIHDLALSRDVRGGFTVGLDVRNLFDRDTRDVARYPLPGRVVFLHFGWSSGPAEGGSP